jgi:hypothetical protein
VRKVSDRREPTVDTDTDTSAGIATAASDMTSAVQRLAKLSRQDSEMGSLVAVLEALTHRDGPLAELFTALTDSAVYLTGFEDEDADDAADRVNDAAHSIAVAREQLADGVLPYLRPLVG